MKHYLQHIVALLIISSLSVQVAFPQSTDWSVPADKQGKLCHFEFDDLTRASGKELFDKNCLSCHGTPGKANFQALVPPPGDPASEKFQNDSDGELHYKIAEGRGLMPSFKNVLSSNEIWDIVSYIRSYHPGYKQIVGEELVFTGFKGELLMNLIFHQDEKQVVIRLQDKTAQGIAPIAGAGVKLFANRYFGSLLVDEEKLTNNEGKAVFTLPGNLPGDTLGNISITAKLSNEEAFGSTTIDTLLAFGTPVHPVSLRAKRAMWNTFRMAPIWLLVAYFSVVLTVWGFIFYVLFHLREIYFIGKAEEEKLKSE